MLANNAINSDVQKRRLALLFTPVVANVDAVEKPLSSQITESMTRC